MFILNIGFNVKANLATLESFCSSIGLKDSLMGFHHLTGLGGSSKPSIALRIISLALSIDLNGFLLSFQ